MVTTGLTRMVSRLLLAPVLAVAVAILVKGYVDVGDGFAAGTIAALGVLLQYVAFGREAVEDALPVRLAPAVAGVGMALVLLVIFLPTLFGNAPLEHVPPPGAGVTKIGTLELITAVAFDVGVCALVLGSVLSIIHFVAIAREEGEDDEEPERGTAGAGR